jgi:hypothetical protein
MLRFAIRRARERGYVARGDVVVATHGVGQQTRSTSMLRVLTVDE